MNIKEYLENNGLKFSEFHQTEAYETGADTGVEFMENNVDFIEDIINSYYETKVQLENEKVEYMNRHDFCTRILDNFKLTGKTYKH